MDDVLCDFLYMWDLKKKENPEIEYPQQEESFWIDLPPLKDAISTVNKLKLLYDVYILTAPSMMNPKCYSGKRIWVENYLGYDLVQKLIITPNKALNKGEFLIDDMTEGKGQDKFEGELIHFGSKKFPDWKTIYNYLEKESKL